MLLLHGQARDRGVVGSRAYEADHRIEFGDHRHFADRAGEQDRVGVEQERVVPGGCGPGESDVAAADEPQILRVLDDPHRNPAIQPSDRVLQRPCERLVSRGVVDGDDRGAEPPALVGA